MILAVINMAVKPQTVDTLDDLFLISSKNRKNSYKGLYAMANRTGLKSCKVTLVNYCEVLI